MIFGLETTHKLPKNWTPLEAVAVIKCLDEDGSLGFVIRSTATLSNWESYGLLDLAAKTQANTVLSNIEDDEEEDES